MDENPGNDSGRQVPLCDRDFTLGIHAAWGQVVNHTCDPLNAGQRHGVFGVKTYGLWVKAARGSIVLSAMLSGSLAILIRLARSKDASVLGYLVAYAKLALVLFVAMRISAVVGFAVGAFVPQSCEPMSAFGGWRSFQLAHVVTMVTLIPVGFRFIESVQRRMLDAKTWLGRGVVFAMLAMPCLAGQCLWMLDWVKMVEVQKTEEEVPQSSPFDNYRLTEDEAGEARI